MYLNTHMYTYIYIYIYIFCHTWGSPLLFLPWGLKDATVKFLRGG